MHAQSIAEVVTLLQQIITEEAEAGSRIALFPALYCELTERVVIGLAAGEFHEVERFEQIAAVFANRYFDALTAHRAGAKPSKSWALAFEMAEDHRLLTVQDLLLGINAHINLDLAIATAEVGGDSIADLERDFLHINALLSELFDGVQSCLGAYSPFLDLLDRVGGNSDEWLGIFMLDKARDAAWQNAVVLAGLKGAARERWELMLDIAASRLGYMIANPGYVVRKALDLIQQTEEQDVQVLTKAIAQVQP